MRKPAFAKRFWIVAVAVMTAVAILNYFPALSGQVPFPRDIVIAHSAWAGQPRSTPRQQVANLIDVVALFYPFRALNALGAEKRELPLWNPYIQSGAPFQANAQSALFNPLAIFYYLFPLKAAWTIDLIARVLLAGLFMILFARSVGACRTGSLVAGILFALCGFTVEWQGMSNGESAIWLPLVSYAVVRLSQRPEARSVAVAAVAFAIPVLAGHPETAVHITLVAIVLAAFLALRRNDLRFVVAFVVSGLLALGLAAVQVIPTVEWIGRLGPQLDNPEPVLDRHQGQGFFSRDINSDPNSALIAIPEGAAYVGMLGLLAACLAPFHKSRSYALFFAGIAVVSVAVAFGFQPVRWIVVHLPVIKAVKNARLILVADFSIAVLAGFGLSVLDGPEIAIPTRSALIYLTAGGLVISACIYELHRATLSPVQFLRSPSGSLLFLILGMVVLWARLKGVIDYRAFPPVILILCAVEMLTFSYGYLGFTPSGEVFAPAPVFNFLHSQADLKDYRVAKDRVPIPHNVGIIYGFESADGYDVTTERTRNFTADLTEDRPDGVMFLAEKIIHASDRRLDMLNVKYLLVSAPSPQADLLTQSRRFKPRYSDGSVEVLENPSALPRIWLVPSAGIEVITDEAAQLDQLKQPLFDPTRSAIFPVRPASLSNAKVEGETSEMVVDHIERTLNSYFFRVESTEPAAVVVSQMYYPGWEASVNGRWIPVYAVDYALTGFTVPSGSSDVHMVFRPKSFVFGAATSLVSGCAVIFLASRRRLFRP